MDRTQAGWGAALSGLVVVGAAAGLIVVGNSDSGSVGGGTDGPSTSEVEQERPRLPMPSDSEAEEGDVGLIPKGAELPGDKEPPGGKGFTEGGIMPDHGAHSEGDESGSGGGAFGPGQPQLPRIDGVGPSAGEN